MRTFFTLFFNSFENSNVTLCICIYTYKISWNSKLFFYFNQIESVFIYIFFWKKKRYEYDNNRNNRRKTEDLRWCLARQLPLFNFFFITKESRLDYKLIDLRRAQKMKRKKFHPTYSTSPLFILYFTWFLFYYFTFFFLALALHYVG